MIRKFLEPLRVFQREIMLKDDVAGEVVRDAARLRVESSLDTALKNVRERTRKKDYSLALKVGIGLLLISNLAAYHVEKISVVHEVGFFTFRSCRY